MIIHSMAVGSNGNGAERYGVFLPFELQNNRTIQWEDNTSIDIGGVQLTLEKMRRGYAFYGGDFESKDHAASFLSDLQTSLLWYSIKRRLGIRYPRTISDVHLLGGGSPILDSHEAYKVFKDQGWEVIHGSYEVEKAYVVPQHLCLARHGTGIGLDRMGPSIDKLESALQETIAFPDLPKLQDHSKLRLGIEMYALSHFEVSEEAQFLSLIASLEATLEPSRVSEESQSAIENAVGEIQSRIDQTESPEKENLQHLLQRVNGLVEKSIEEKFIDQIASRGDGLGLLVVHDLPKTLASACTTRSRLIQDGWVDQQQLHIDLFFFREFVPAYFENEYRRVTGAL